MPVHYSGIAETELIQSHLILMTTWTIIMCQYTHFKVPPQIASEPRQFTISNS